MYQSGAFNSVEPKNDAVLIGNSIPLTNRINYAKSRRMKNDAEDTLISNEVFSSFKQEMEKMLKTIKNLEKENLGLRKKMKESNKSIIELVEERGAQKESDWYLEESERKTGTTLSIAASREEATPSYCGRTAGRPWIFR